MGKADTKSTHRHNRSICVPFSQEVYGACVRNPEQFRAYLNEQIELFPELFPAAIGQGYRMKDIYNRKKHPVPIRRIEVAGVAYTVRPSFLMPYITGVVEEVERALFLRKFNVPFWALSYVFGQYPMYWYRLEQSLGRNSIVGTTVRDPDDIARHLAADEKHTRILGNKAYVATTVGNHCVLGAAVAGDAGEQSLQDAYQVFKHEAQCIEPSYAPTTVNMDGWRATLKAWRTLFASVVIICCFLHVFIKIRDRAKRKYKDIFDEAATKLWECYEAESKATFVQRVRRLAEWCKKKNMPSVISKPIEKLRQNIAKYKAAYDHPEALRTSNMVDRLMQRMDRHLFSTQYFHGSIAAAELSIRGWALIHNFAPYNPRTVKKLEGFKSPAERLNQFRYHSNWLSNLCISASLGGYRSPPLKPG